MRSCAKVLGGGFESVEARFNKQTGFGWKEPTWTEIASAANEDFEPVSSLKD